MINADLHNHFASRGDNIGQFRETILDNTKKTLGKNGLVGFVNFGDFRYEAFLNSINRDLVVAKDCGSFYDPRNEVYVVKGQEVNTNGGHLLVLGLGIYDKINSGLSPQDTVKAAKDLGGIIILPHMFGYQGISKRLCLQMHDIDAIETYNSEACLGLPFSFSPLDSRANVLAKDYYSRIVGASLKGLGAISSSDGHSPEEIGRAYTELDFDPSKPNFRENLREAIRKTNLSSQRLENTSYLGAMHHLGCVIFDTGMIKANSIRKKIF